MRTQMNRSPGNKVSFDEFLVLMHQAGVETTFQAEIREVREVFNKYDRKKKGEVRKELHHAFIMLNRLCTTIPFVYVVVRGRPRHVRCLEWLVTSVPVPTCKFYLVLSVGIYESIQGI